MSTALELFNIDEEICSLVYGMTPEDLTSYADLHQRPESDKDLETCAYIGLYTFIKVNSLEYLENAYQCSRKWVSLIENINPDYTRRCQILGTLQRERIKKGLSLMQQVMESSLAARQSGRQMPKDLEALITILNSLGAHVAPILVDKLSILDKVIPLSLQLERRLKSHLEGHVPSPNEQAEITTLAVDELECHIQSLQHMAYQFVNEAERTNNAEHADNAVSFMRIAERMLPEDKIPLKAEVLLNLGGTIGYRAQKTGSMSDLNESIDLITQAMNTAPAVESRFRSIGGCWNNLAEMLGERFQRTGSRQDLERAVEAASIAATHDQDKECARFLDNLGKRLLQRYQLNRSMTDLRGAVDATKKASETTSRHEMERTARLANYSTALGHLYERTNGFEYLHHSVRVAEDALEVVPEGHSLYAPSWNRLALCLETRYKRTKESEDLRRAIDASTRALKWTSKNDPKRPGYLQTYADLLGLRYEKTSQQDDLDKSIEAWTEVVDATPSDHPMRASRVGRLAERLLPRIDELGVLHDHNLPENTDQVVKFMTSTHMALERIVAYSLEGFRCENATTIDRIISANRATYALNFYPDEWGLPFFKDHWKISHELLEEAISLLPKLSPRTLAHVDKQHIITRIDGLGPDAAAIALNAEMPIYNAIKLLEFGRGIIANSLLEIRGDISMLSQIHPDLASEFMSLRDELDSVSTEANTYTEKSTTTDLVLPFSDNPAEGIPEVKGTLLESTNQLTPIWELKAKFRREAEDRFSQLLTKIRYKDGFRDFLLLPSEYKLKLAAEHGPIAIINISRYRCDAFLIEHCQIRVIPLSESGLTLASVQKQVEQLRSARLSSSHSAFYQCLKWLWYTVAKPCLDALGFNKPRSNLSDENLKRLWWIPTGPLCHLPLHAAGDYRSPGESVMDRVMSSYALSVKALIFSRRNRDITEAESKGLSNQSTESHALLVGMAKTMGFKDLPFASKEVEMLKSLLPDLQLKLAMPEGRKAEVLRYLKSCSLFHFAGHGRVDRHEPSRSCLLLADWEDDPLTVDDLRDSRFQDNLPFLSFLSACSTGANMPEKLADEGIHLVSAFQLAGFRHVVGTLWEVVDEHCVDIARVFYEIIRDAGMSDLTVCQALHRAVRCLRDRHLVLGHSRGDLCYNEGLNDGTDRDDTDENEATNLYLQKERDGVLLKTEPKLETSWVSYIHFGP